MRTMCVVQPGVLIMIFPLAVSKFYKNGPEDFIYLLWENRILNVLEDCESLVMFPGPRRYGLAWLCVIGQSEVVNLMGGNVRSLSNKNELMQPARHGKAFFCIFRNSDTLLF